VNEREYWRRTVAIIVDEEKTFRREYLDRGRFARALDGDPTGTGSTYSAADRPACAPKVRPLTDPETDEPISEPIPLDGEGQPLSPEAAPKYGKWRIFRETSWADLQLP
jgi:hypothetical protein